MEKLITFHKKVDWDKWFVKEDRGFVFTLKVDPNRKAIFNFSRKNILVYQLIYKTRDMSAVMTYDNLSLYNILNDWEQNKIYCKLKV